MNNNNYILVDRNVLIAIANTLRQIDDVKGFHNMDLLVSSVGALQDILKGSPAVNVSESGKNPVVENPELIDAIEAAKAEEEARK